LQVDQVQVNGQSVTPGMLADPTVLEVRLVEPLPPGARLAVEFEFSGAVPVDFASELGSSAYGIYNTSDGILTLANFYPILAAQDATGWNLNPVYPVGDAVYSEIALYAVQVEVPQDLVIATAVRSTR
jgi:hypothetical protein